MPTNDQARDACGLSIEMVTSTRFAGKKICDRSVLSFSLFIRPGLGVLVFSVQLHDLMWICYRKHMIALTLRARLPTLYTVPVPTRTKAFVVGLAHNNPRPFSMTKRKRSSLATEVAVIPSSAVLPTNLVDLASDMIHAPVRRSSTRKTAQPPPALIDPNPDTNESIIDSKAALRASPDAEGKEEEAKIGKAVRARGKKTVVAITPDAKVKEETEEPTITKPSNPRKASSTTPADTKSEAAKDRKGVEREDPEAEGDEEAADPEEIQEALSRPPPINSSYLPLPWKGRLGYACLNTYLRTANPPVFSSRTCRIASILEHRHPLKDPSQPEHATKNRPDKDQPADVARGQAYVEALCLANARDIPKMLRWNHRYAIKFLRLSSEMFPFASHEVYGYKLAPFASEALAEAGRVAAELGHRLTTHPGQFTQLGSPRKEVITASIRDLEYHCELLDLLKLPPQQDRDAVMILHMGGVFGDKAATLQRFRQNYQALPQGIKNRLVLENDDVCYTVHDLLPICESLNIPLVLDYHHHNILFDSSQLREGTLDIMMLYDRIAATWQRKGITQKMHYSEPTPSAITARQRRKHNPRVATLPPCPDTMDLMIEAKDKEQAVFELMRTFKLPGCDTFADILPHTRNDENKPWRPPPPPKKRTPKKRKSTDVDADDDEVNDPEPEPAQPPPPVPEPEVSMGGPQGRVYWPPGMESWLRPRKREVKPRDSTKALGLAEKAAAKRAEKAAWQAAREASAEVKDGGQATLPSASVVVEAAIASASADKAGTKKKKQPARAPKAKSTAAKGALKNAKARKLANAVPTPSTSEPDDSMEPSEDGDEVDEEDEDASMPDLTDGEEEEEEEELVPRASLGTARRARVGKVARGKTAAPELRKAGGRPPTRKRKRVQYNEAEDDEEDEEEEE